MTDIQVRPTSFYFLVPVVSKADNQMVKWTEHVWKQNAKKNFEWKLEEAGDDEKLHNMHSLACGRRREDSLKVYLKWIACEDNFFFHSRKMYWLTNKQFLTVATDMRNWTRGPKMCCLLVVSVCHKTREVLVSRSRQLLTKREEFYFWQGWNFLPALGPATSPR